MARLRDVVFDSHHPASAARFWAAVLDGYDVAPYDEPERLCGLGARVLAEHRGHVLLEDPEGNEFCLLH